jgi:hypothetical protein
VITPVLAVWLYVLHRLAGPRLRWRAGLAWAGAVAVVVAGMVGLHSLDPRQWSVVGPKEGEQYFAPSAGAHGHGQFHPGAHAHAGSVLPGMPPGRLCRLVSQRAPVQLVQQPGLPVQHPRDARGGVAAGWQREGVALVRGVPRPGAVFQRGV